VGVRTRRPGVQAVTLRRIELSTDSRTWRQLPIHGLRLSRNHRYPTLSISFQLTPPGGNAPGRSGRTHTPPCTDLVASFNHAAGGFCLPSPPKRPLSHLRGLVPRGALATGGTYGVAVWLRRRAAAKTDLSCTMREPIRPAQLQTTPTPGAGYCWRARPDLPPGWLSRIPDEVTRDFWRVRRVCALSGPTPDVAELCGTTPAPCADGVDAR